MTEKRFGYGAGVDWQEDVIIDYKTEKSYDFYEVGKLLNELAEKNKQLSKLNKILVGFLLDKGYDFKDIIKFVQERTDEKGDV